jgi:hypothetical protein
MVSTVRQVFNITSNYGEYISTKYEIESQKPEINVLNNTIHHQILSAPVSEDFVPIHQRFYVARFRRDCR